MYMFIKEKKLKTFKLRNFRVAWVVNMLSDCILNQNEINAALGKTYMFLNKNYSKFTFLYIFLYIHSSIPLKLFTGNAQQDCCQVNILKTALFHYLFTNLCITIHLIRECSQKTTLVDEKNRTNRTA